MDLIDPGVKRSVAHPNAELISDVDGLKVRDRISVSIADQGEAPFQPAFRRQRFQQQLFLRQLLAMTSDPLERRLLLQHKGPVLEPLTFAKDSPQQ